MRDKSTSQTRARSGRQRRLLGALTAVGVTMSVMATGGGVSFAAVHSQAGQSSTITVWVDSGRLPMAKAWVKAGTCQPITQTGKEPSLWPAATATAQMTTKGKANEKHFTMNIQGHV